MWKVSISIFYYPISGVKVQLFKFWKVLSRVENFSLISSFGGRIVGGYHVYMLWNEIILTFGPAQNKTVWCFEFSPIHHYYLWTKFKHIRFHLDNQSGRWLELGIKHYSCRVVEEEDNIPNLLPLQLRSSYLYDKSNLGICFWWCSIYFVELNFRITPPLYQYCATGTGGSHGGDHVQLLKGGIPKHSSRYDSLVQVHNV